MADGWYSARELASMGLPGLPSTERAIRSMADRQTWESRATGRAGGGREYPVATLPAKTQYAIGERALKNTPVLAVIDTRSVEDLKTYQRKSTEARSVVLAHIDQLVGQGLSRAKAAEAFIAAAKAGKLPEDAMRLVRQANARSGTERTVSRATIFNWLKARDRGDGNIAALAPAAVESAAIPPWAHTFMTLYGRPTQPNLTEVMEAWPVNQIRPSYDQARRFLKRLDTVSRNAGRLGPRALRSLKAYSQRDISNLWPGAVFIGDGHTFKAEVAHPGHGRPFRPEITAILDVYTRRWVGWSVALSENTWSVADALRHAVTTTTTPDIFYYDNGSGANNGMWDADVTGLTARLGITKKNSIPWVSQSRGVIERFNSTVLHKDARKLPTYVGQRMDKEARQKAFKITRRDIKAVGTSPLLMSWQDFIASMVESQNGYNTRSHSTLPKIIDPVSGKRRHLTPDEAWFSAINDDWQPEPIAADEARTLFRPAIMRNVARGWVKLFNNEYFHASLEHLHGEQVSVGYDIHDPAKVTISLPDGRFVCEAELNGNTRDYFPISVLEQARQKRIEGKLKRLEAHRDTALAEGGPALIEQRFVPPTLTEFEAARQEKFEAEFEAGLISSPIPDVEKNKQMAAEVIQIETAGMRFARAIDIEQRLDADDETVTGDEAKWLARYVRTPEYTSRKMVFEDFGAEAFAE